jgi:hypothetical protein
VEVLHRDAHAYLTTLPGASFDVVLFDPMFSKARRASPAFEALRRFADPSPLTVEALAEARRVARRWVVVKAARYSTDLKRLGLAHEPAPRTATVVWARVPGQPSP